MSLLKVWPVYKDNSGSDYHRIRLPFEHGAHWTDQSLMTQVDLHSPNLPEIMCSKVDMIVSNRTGTFATKDLKKFRDQFGFKYVVDMDDDINLPTYHPMFKEYKNGIRAAIIEQLECADMVTVTTNYLAEQLQKYNKNIHVLPNAIPFNYGHFKKVKRPENELYSFIYAGQTSHLEDVKLLDSAMRWAKNGLSNIARVGMAGMKPNKVNYKFGKRPDVLVPAIVTEMFKTFQLGPNPFAIEHLPLNKYMHLYDDMDCSLVPLTIDTFNFGKSNLKILEAAAKGIPAIVSNVKPYSFDNDAPVLWVNKSSDWIDHMRRLALDRVYSINMGDMLKDWAELQYNLDDVNMCRFELYYNLVGKTFPDAVNTAGQNTE